jgi:hypothetical protein
VQRRLDVLGDEFHDSAYYIERDGLGHYQEASCEVGAPWQDPWINTDEDTKEAINA